MRPALLIFLLLTAGTAAGAEPLPRLLLIPGSLTVSGFSSGGYMAVQAQVVWSKDVAGAGVIAAGPWYCAMNSPGRALVDCLGGDTAGPAVAPLIRAAREAAAAGLIDDLSWLAPDRVWMLHGAEDAVVGAAVMDALRRFYREFLPPERVLYETRVPAGHGFPTTDAGGPCAAAAPPWLNDCDYDAAGELLRTLYDDLQAPVAARESGLRPFDQSRYVERSRSSLADEGFVYLPADCAAGKPCRVHLVFHGCGQGSGFVGRLFAKESGYNRWAEANRIVVLYPQVAKSWFLPFNPQGCWDWWGYSGADYAWREGAQLSALRRMLRALGL